MGPQVGGAAIAGKWAMFIVASFIIILGGVLRFAWIGGPYLQPDEPIAVTVVSHLVTHGDWDTDWARTGVGTRFGSTQYNFSSYYLSLSLLDRMWDGVPAGATTESLEWRFEFFRACSAGFGTLALALTMILAWKIQGPVVAGAAGLWLAVNPLLVQDSHYARPEAFFTLLSVGLIWLAWSPRPAPAWRCAGAGILFGLLVACKVTMVLWFWLPVVGCLPERPGGMNWGGGGTWGRLGLVATGAFAGFAAGVPHAVTDWRGYLAGLHYLNSQYGHAWGPYSHGSGGPVFDYLGRYLLETAGWGCLIFFAVGLLNSIVRRNWRVFLVVFLPPVVLAAFLGAHAVFMERNLSHAVPLYAVGAGLGLSAVVEAGRLRPWRRSLAVLLVTAGALVPAVLTARMVFRGFSGRYDRAGEAARSELFAGLKLPASSRNPVVAFVADPTPLFDQQWEHFHGPFIVLWADVSPPFTRQCLIRLQKSYQLEVPAAWPGLFADLQGPNTLRDYLAPTTLVLVVRRPRNQTAGGRAAGSPAVAH